MFTSYIVNLLLPPPTPVKPPISIKCVIIEGENISYIIIFIIFLCNYELYTGNVNFHSFNFVSRLMASLVDNHPINNNPLL